MSILWPNDSQYPDRPIGLVSAIVTFGLTVGAAVGLALYGPIFQPAHYHDLADAVTWFGLPNAANVLSNIGFALVAIWGWLTLRPRRASDELRGGWPGYRLFLIGLFLTAFGSAFYHLAPDNFRLIWDRLPIALGFMGLLSAVVAERVSVRAGVRSLTPLLAFGALSVLYWALSGDLRIYLLTQFGAILAVLILASVWRSRYTHGGAVFAAIGLYGLAKVTELYDRTIFESTGGAVSGHTLKHLLAALALYAILWSLERRTTSAVYRSPASPSRSSAPPPQSAPPR